MKNRLSIVIRMTALALFLLSAQWSSAAETTASFDTANKLYAQGKFTEAAAMYERLIQSGTASAAVYFNLGNARFKSGNVGKAVAAYRHAEQLAPRDPDLRANLEFVQNQIQGPSLESSRLQNQLKRLTINEWTVATAVAFWLWLLLLTAVQLRTTWKQSLRMLIWLSAAATITLAVCLGSVLSLHSHQLAIITTHDASVRNGPLDESQAAFTVHDGAELRVLDTKDGWLQVTLGNRIGWLKREQAIALPEF
ncbi:MAG: tetratricopeptide repeat protein [Verrucomicrobiota bacterium]